MTALATSKYRVLLDTSNTKISRSSLPNCRLSRHTQVLLLTRLLEMMNFLLLLVMVKISGPTRISISYLQSTGSWDSTSGQSAAYFIRRGIVAKQSLSTICENIMDRCLSKHSYGEGNWGRDNMTAIIINLLKGSSLEEWCSNSDGLCTGPEFGETPSIVIS